MLTSYHTLSYITSSLQERLTSCAIVEAFSQERDELVLCFDKIDDALVISCDRVINTLYLQPRFSRAHANSIDVLSKSLGKLITSVKVHPVDRVIQFYLDSGERLDTRFFGSKSNVVLVNPEEIIIDAFKNAKNTVATRTDYRNAEIIYDIDALRARLAKPQLATVASLLKEEFPTLGTTVIKELLHRADVPGNVGAMSITEMHLKDIQLALGSVFADLADPAPRVYVGGESKGKSQSIHFAVIPLLHLGALAEQRFDDVHDAVRFYIAQLRSFESVEEKKQSLIGKLNQKLTKVRRTIETMEMDKHISRPDEYQRYGEWLMSNHQNMKKGDTKALMIDTGQDVEITLSKELSPIQNAQKYFEKAKRSRIARQQTSERLADLGAIIPPAEKLITLIDEVKTTGDMNRFLMEHKEELEELGMGEKNEKREQLPFRIFTVDGGFEVWAGKSSKTNDQLTMKYSKPNDLWFHARGAAGSHVVLKVNTGKGEPGKKAKEQAAGIAAYYSKMKNAKMVPVAVAEKKYVRKPKGAAPGSVVVEREKLIFAEPALPREKRPLK